MRPLRRRCRPHSSTRPRSCCCCAGSSTTAPSAPSCPLAAATRSMRWVAFSTPSTKSSKTATSSRASSFRTAHSSPPSKPTTRRSPRPATSRLAPQLTTCTRARARPHRRRPIWGSWCRRSPGLGCDSPRRLECRRSSPPSSMRPLRARWRCLRSSSTSTCRTTCPRRWLASRAAFTSRLRAPSSSPIRPRSPSFTRCASRDRPPLASASRWVPGRCALRASRRCRSP